MKVTYNIYSCAMSGMSRESMKMEGQESAECQNWEKKDIKISFLELFKLEKDKKGMVSSSSKRKKGRKTWEERSLAQEA